MTGHMDLTRFEELAMTHGPDTDSWPKPLRAEAETLLASSAAARGARDRAAALFDALGAETARPAPVSDALMARILADAATASPVPYPRPSRRKGYSFRALWRFAPPAALAACALLGVTLGYSAPASYADTVIGTADDEIWIEAMNLTEDPGLFGDIDEGEGL